MAALSSTYYLKYNPLSIHHFLKLTTGTTLNVKLPVLKFQNLFIRLIRLDQISIYIYKYKSIKHKTAWNFLLFRTIRSFVTSFPILKTYPLEHTCLINLVYGFTTLLIFLVLISKIRKVYTVWNAETHTYLRCK